MSSATVVIEADQVELPGGEEVSVARVDLGQGSYVVTAKADAQGEYVRLLLRVTSFGGMTEGDFGVLERDVVENGAVFYCDQTVRPDSPPTGIDRGTVTTTIGADISISGGTAEVICSSFNGGSVSDVVLVALAFDAVNVSGEWPGFLN